MIKVGKRNHLKVLKQVSFGVYLDGEEQGEILLPGRFVPEGCAPGDSLDVFIYFDSEDNIIATTEKPRVMAGQFASLEVVDLTQSGAFLDWGLSKDLLVPFREQRHRMIKGRSYMVHVYLDNVSNRLVASTKLDRFLDNEPAEYSKGQAVDLQIAEKTDLGYKTIIEGKHWGILYHSDVFQDLKQGQHVNGYIKKRRNDGKIDVSLHEAGYKKVDRSTQDLLDLLAENDGFLNVTDKSSPETIRELLGMSKKTFKKSVGALYKQRRIALEPDGIRLLIEKKSSG